MVFQNYALFPHMDVTGNVSYGLSMRHVPKAEKSQRVAEALDVVGLGGYADRRIDQLSGGQQQRVALARESEEHTSELQSRGHLVCRLLLEKKENSEDWKKHQQ